MEIDVHQIKSNTKGKIGKLARRAIALCLSASLAFGNFAGLQIGTVAHAATYTTLTPTAQQRANMNGCPEMFTDELYTYLEKWNKPLSWPDVIENVSDFTKDIQDSESYASNTDNYYHLTFGEMRNAQSTLTFPDNGITYIVDGVDDERTLDIDCNFVIQGKVVFHGFNLDDYSSTVENITIASGGCLYITEKENSVSGEESRLWSHQINVQSGGSLYTGHCTMSVTPVSVSGFMESVDTPLIGDITVNSSGYVSKMVNTGFASLTNSGFIKELKNCAISRYSDASFINRGQIETIRGGKYVSKTGAGIQNNGTIGQFVSVGLIGTMNPASQAFTSSQRVPMYCDYGFGTVFGIFWADDHANIEGKTVVDTSKLKIMDSSCSWYTVTPNENWQLALTYSTTITTGGSSTNFNLDDYESSVVVAGNPSTNIIMQWFDVSQYFSSKQTETGVRSTWTHETIDPNNMGFYYLVNSEEYNPLTWTQQSDGSWTTDITGLQIGDRVSFMVYNIPKGEGVEPDLYSTQGSMTFGIDDVKITKLTNPTSPVAPALESRTSTSVTLVTQDGYQYSNNGGASYQNSPTFTGLSPQTKYSFVQRIKETSTYLASAASTPIEVYTLPSPPSTPVLQSKTDTTIEVTTVPGQQYRLGEGEWQESGTFESLTPNTEYSITTRVAESGEIPASDPSSPLEVTTDKSVAVAPGEIEVAVTDTGVTIDSKGETYEYKLDKVHTSYQSEAGFTGLSSETEYTITYRRPETRLLKLLLRKLFPLPQRSPLQLLQMLQC